MNTAPALPPAVTALLADLRRVNERRKDIGLTDTDFVIAEALYQQKPLQAIGDALGLTRQAVHRRKGVIRDGLQIYYLHYRSDLDGDAYEAYKQIYLRIR